MHGKGEGVHDGGMCYEGMHGGGMHGGGMHGRGAYMACTPPDKYYEIWSMSGQYASYWNAFLFVVNVMVFIVIIYAYQLSCKFMIKILGVVIDFKSCDQWLKYLLLF